MDTSEDVDSASEDDNISPEDKVALFCSPHMGELGACCCWCRGSISPIIPLEFFFEFFCKCSRKLTLKIFFRQWVTPRSVGASMGTYLRLRRTREALPLPPFRVQHGPTRLLLLWDEISFGSKHVSRLEVKYAAVRESARRAAHSLPPSSGTDAASRLWQCRPQ